MPVESQEVVITIRLTPGWAARCLQIATRLPRLDLLMRSVVGMGMGFALCANTIADIPVRKPVLVVKADPRAGRLERFFRIYGCPAPHHVAEYLRAADN